MKSIAIATMLCFVIVAVLPSVYAIHEPNDPIVTTNNDGETFVTMRLSDAFAQPTSNIEGASVVVNPSLDIATITNAFIAIVTAIPSVAVTWALVRNKLKSIRELFDVVDDALYDDKVTEEEYRAIHEKLAKLVKS